MRIRLFGHYMHLPVVSLALAEFVAFGLSIYAAVVLRLGTDHEAIVAETGAIWPRALVFALSMSVCFLALGLYTTRQRAGAVGLGLRMIVASFAATAALSTLLFAVPQIRLGRGILLAALVISLLGAVVARFIASRVGALEGIKRRVLVYGSSVQMVTFNRMRRRSDRAGYNLVGMVCQSGDTPDLLDPLTDRIYEAPNGLGALCVELDIDELVVALQDRRQTLPVKDLLQCRLAGVTVLEFISFMERETGRIQLDLLNPSWIIFGQGFRRDGVRLFTARALDFAASGMLLVLASPLMLITMLAIWLEDGRKGGSVFYRQARVGFEGKVFHLTKFRSMRVDAEAGGAQWAQKNDPRVTRVGAFIRKTRIDELPQLLNVLKGHMGFVGPRPERPEFVVELEAKIPFYAYRHSVKPGITGWAQLCYPYGSSVEDAAQKLQYDLYYVKNHNLLFDITILLQTVEVVLMGKGAR
jgi:sugar transferase (PEP-CTERM system associated)